MDWGFSEGVDRRTKLGAMNWFLRVVRPMDGGFSFGKLRLNFGICRGEEVVDISVGTFKGLISQPSKPVLKGGDCNSAAEEGLRYRSNKCHWKKYHLLPGGQ